MPKLQRLRVPSDWSVLHNSFCEIDPTQVTDEEVKALPFFHHDILVASRPDFLVTLDWDPPSEPLGAYLLSIFANVLSTSGQAEFKLPLYCHRTRSRMEVVELLETLLHDPRSLFGNQDEWLRRAPESEQPDSTLAWATYHVRDAILHDDGTISIPAGGHQPDQGIWDGHLVVKTDDPSHPFWKWLAANWAFQSLNSTDIPMMERKFKEWGECIS